MSSSNSEDNHQSDNEQGYNDDDDMQIRIHEVGNLDNNRMNEEEGGNQNNNEDMINDNASQHEHSNHQNIIELEHQPLQRQQLEDQQLHQIPLHQMQSLNNNNNNNNVEMQESYVGNNHLMMMQNLNNEANYQNQNNNHMQQSALQHSQGGNQQKSPLPQHLNDLYYKKADHNSLPPPVQFSPDIPHMKITVMKTNMANDIQQVYNVTPEGMVDSKKNTVIEDIVIGRQQQTAVNQQQPEIYPNDIVLPGCDRAISRIHCKIIYKDGFRVNKPITDTFLQFLKINSEKARKTPACFWTKLPNLCIRMIWRFLQAERKFYIVDIGSVYGTYIRIKPNKEHQIEKGQIYLIGADTLFNVIEINNGYTDDGFNKEQSNTKLFQMLQDEKQKNSMIYGLEEREKLQLTESQYQKENLNETSSLHSISRPYLKLELQNPPHQVAQNHIFISKYDDIEKEFKIGRSQECDIVISQNTISRKQSRIYYKNRQWYLMDGDNGRESANGTWISLSDYRERRQSGNQRTESDPREIEDGSEIKISDSILKIEVLNNDKKSNERREKMVRDNRNDRMEEENVY